METTITLRAKDAARAAAIARAIGIPLLDPDRPNPECWHVRTPVTFMITAAHGEPQLVIGPSEFDATLAALEPLIGTAVIETSSDGNRATLEMEGFEISIERDAPVMRFRDIVDIGSRYGMLPFIADHRGAIRAALDEIGAGNPRLVGPALGRTGGERRWTLVVDAPESADLAAVEAFIVKTCEGSARLAVRRSADFSPEHIAEIDIYAYDV